MATIVTRIGKGAPLSIVEGDANFTNLNNDKIELTDLSITTATDGETSALSYNNTTGVFTFTPVVISDLIGLTDISVSTLTNSGSGSLTYNNATGVFTFAPADFSAKLSNLAQDTAPQLGGNLDVQSRSIITSVTNGDITVQSNGTGKIVLSAPSIDVPGVLANPSGPIKLVPQSGNSSVDLGTDSVLLGKDTNSTEVVLSVGNTANADLKIRGGGTGKVLIDTGVKLNAGALDLNNFDITSTVTNGNLTLTPNGTGVVLVNAGSGLRIATGVVETPTDIDLDLKSTGTGAVILNQTGGVVVTNTGASGFGVITGGVNTGVSLLTNAGSNGGNDPTLSLSNGGGAELNAGATSALTLEGATVNLLGDTNIDALNSYAENIDVLAGVSGILTIDPTAGPIKLVIPSGNITINGFSNPVGGQTVSFVIDQSSNETSFTLTLGAGILLPSGTAPTLTALGNDLLTITCLDDVNGLYIATFVADFQ